MKQPLVRSAADEALETVRALVAAVERNPASLAWVKEHNLLAPIYWRAAGISLASDLAVRNVENEAAVKS